MEIKQRHNRVIDDVLEAELNERDKKLKEKEEIIKQRIEQHDAMIKGLDLIDDEKLFKSEEKKMTIGEKIKMKIKNSMPLA